MVINLLRLYEEFIEYHSECFTRDVRSWLGVSELDLSDEDVRIIYNTFYKHTFVEFYTFVRDIIYSDNPLDFIKDTNKEAWDLWCYISFLSSKDLINFRDGKFEVCDDLKNILIPRYSEDEILHRIKAKIELNSLNEPTVKVLKRLAGIEFDYKPQFDQMPISIESAICLISTIFKYYPFYDKFLFLGDDDFISILITLVEPKFKPIVADLDERILNIVKSINEGIEAFKRDFTKRRRINREVLGFCTNPPYNELGIKTFLRYGLMHFGELGGRVFLEFGDEAIGRKLLILQRFITRNNLEITDIIKGRINYPFMLIHPENNIIYRRLLKYFTEDMLKSNYMLGADIYVLTYIPWSIKPIRIKDAKIYSYI